MSRRSLHAGIDVVDQIIEVDSDPSLLRSAYGGFPTGVAAISAHREGQTPSVLVASSFQVGISLDPPLVLFAVQHTSTSWPLLRESERIGVSVLADGHSTTARQLASRAPDRFAGIDIISAPGGATFIRGASVWMETSIHYIVPAGDHDLVLLFVHGLATLPSQDPLIWHASGFRTLTAVDRPHQ